MLEEDRVECVHQIFIQQIVFLLIDDIVAFAVLKFVDQVSDLILITW